MYKNSIRLEEEKDIKKKKALEIRKSIESDKLEIENIHTKAFGETKGPEIAELVKGLFHDKTALPILSLVAVEDEKLVGHILYTKVKITQTTKSVSARILAPLAVLPDFQSKGIGVRLIREGLNLLKDSGVELVFVLGHPGYYPRVGFTPAGVLGYEAPYHIPKEYAGAWMVQELSPGVIGRIKGAVQCSNVLNQPEHWRE
ncbi:GNAT family N-acetyltransferase [Desulfobacula phenolica]|uniref:Acetyltransferase (GNAT) domain-containing protein n=1 Tax=Desulfobacula phenolica TaxID=90732 RepID=A0A1H2FPY0_9BACT|nr:N-acetyltransferase [Desulfobacula phenolica]SDU09352.1 Acetyltransferase (GNAT) domain-containing protein [Desulfobacula phenolica]